MALVALLVAGAGTLVAVRAFRSVDPTPPAATAANGRIAFVSGADGDIYLTGTGDRGPGRIVERHAAGQEGALAMVWSPDGTRIAFTDYTSGGSVSLYAMNSDGSALVELSAGLSDADSPSWSPDGTMIAFTGFDGDHGYEIYVVGPDGTGLSRLTDEADNGVDGAHMPAWSPDGARIAYYANRYDEASQTKSQAIFTMGTDGSHPVRVSDGSAIDESPIWSPDATKIAFTRKAGDDSEVYVAHADGTGLVNVSNHPALDWAASWSPDGTGLLLVSQREGDYDIYLGGVDGRNLTRLTDGPSDDRAPVWSPDGARIAFASNRAGSFDVYVMNTDGTEVTRVTDGARDDYPQAWLPIPASEQDPTPSATPTPTEPPPTIEPHPAASWQIGPQGNVSSVLAAYGSAWVAWLDDSGESKLTRVDASTNEIAATIALEAGPGWVSDGGGMAAGADSIWVTGEDRGSAILHRIDPSSNRIIATIRLGDGVGADVAVDEAAVWVAASDLAVGGSSRLLRVDPETNQVVAEIPLEFEYVREVIAANGTILVRQLHWHGEEGGPYTIWAAIDGRANSVVASTAENAIFGMWVWNDEVWTTR